MSKPRQLDPIGASAQFEQAQGLHRAGQLGLAESHYARAVKLDPGLDEAWHLLGVIAFQQGQHAKAIRQFHKALALRPRHAQAHNNLALALKAKGDRTAARAAFAQALAVRPEYVEAALNLGLLEAEAGELAAAEATFRLALAWQPERVELLTNLGNLLRRAGRSDPAVALLKRAHDIAGDADSAGNLALALLDQGDYPAAREIAARALALAPQERLWLEALGAAERLAGDVDAALLTLERANAAAVADTDTDSSAGTALELGMVRQAAGDDGGARSAFAQAQARAPAWLKPRWFEALALNTLNGDEAAIDADLARFGAGLARLRSDLDAAPAPEALLEAAASISAMRLAYRPAQVQALEYGFGDLIGAAVGRALPALCDQPAPRAGGARIRVGWVSSYFGAHTVSRYFGRLIDALPRSEFELLLWSTADRDDARSAALAARVDRFERPRGSLAELGAQIRAADLDLLIYPDIHLDPRQQVLAAMRLAPQQWALYGHPATSGLASIDCFVSGAALEPPAAQRHYRERLILLPGLGAAPEAPSAAPDRAWFDGVRDRQPWLVCAQSLSKLTPAFERAAAAILAQSGARLLLFDRGAALGRRYAQGLAQRLAASAVDIRAQVHVLPARSYAEFLGALAGADLVLDTPWFSGGATSLDALALGVPVLTLEGAFARGRQTAAMLRLVGADELIASDEADYVRRAHVLLAERERHRALGERIGKAAPALFEPTAVAAAFKAQIRAAVAPR